MTVLKAINDEQGRSYEAMAAEIAALRAQNEALRKASAGKITLKVSDKGAVSAYGMGKWPVTLYASQWSRLLDRADDIRAFLEANRDQLAVKGE